MKKLKLFFKKIKNTKWLVITFRVLTYIFALIGIFFLIIFSLGSAIINSEGSSSKFMIYNNDLETRQVVEPKNVFNAIYLDGSNNITITTETLYSFDFGKALHDELLNQFSRDSGLWNGGTVNGAWKNVGKGSVNYYLGSGNNYQTTKNYNYVKFGDAYNGDTLTRFTLNVNAYTYYYDYYYALVWDFSYSTVYFTLGSYTGSYPGNQENPQLKNIVINYSAGNGLYSAVYNIRNTYQPNPTDYYNNGYQDGYQAGLDAGANSFNDIDNDLSISSNYDFRTWVASEFIQNLGVFKVKSISYTHGDVVGYNIAISGGSSWNLGNKTYNAIVLTLISVDPNIKLFNNSSGLVDTAGTFLGDTYNDIYFLSAVNYAYFNETNYSSYVDTGYHIATNNILDYADYKLKVIDGYEVLIDTSNNTYFDFNKSVWVNNAFRHLNNFISSNLLCPIPQFYESFTLYQVLTLSDNSIDNDSSYIVNVFNVIRLAFNSISGFMAIQVLPHITIGVLIAIPLVFAVVMAIIKILRK